MSYEICSNTSQSLEEDCCNFLPSFCDIEGIVICWYYSTSLSYIILSSQATVWYLSLVYEDDEQIPYEVRYISRLDLLNNSHL